MTEEQKKEAMRRYREERAEYNRKRTLNPNVRMPIFQPLTAAQIYEKYGDTETVCGSGACYEVSKNSPKKPSHNPYNVWNDPKIYTLKVPPLPDKLRKDLIEPVELPKNTEYDIKWVQAGDFQLLERYEMV